MVSWDPSKRLGDTVVLGFHSLDLMVLHPPKALTSEDKKVGLRVRQPIGLQEPPRPSCVGTLMSYFSTCLA